jgi:hypothetical protein
MCLIAKDNTLNYFEKMFLMLVVLVLLKGILVLLFVYSSNAVQVRNSIRLPSRFKFMQIEYNANNFKLPPGSIQTFIHSLTHPNIAFFVSMCPLYNLSLNIVSGISYPTYFVLLAIRP